MATKIDESSFPSSFSWDRLPIGIQESILVRLPISSLLRLAATSRSLRSLVRSPSFHSAYRSSSPAPPRQPLFLFLPRRSTADSQPTDSPFLADAYDPLSDHWFVLRLPQAALSSRICNGSLILSQPMHPSATFLVCHAFSSHHPPIPVLIPASEDKRRPFYPVTIISDPQCPENFKIVVVSLSFGVVSTKIFDSRSRQWTACLQFPDFYEVIHSAALLGTSSLYFASGLDDLLKLDMELGRWEVVTRLPTSYSIHVVFFKDKLLCVGGLEDEDGLFAIDIYEMDWETKKWELYCPMPDDLFAEHCKMGCHFHVADCAGTLCVVFTKSSSIVTSPLMCDLAQKKWWRPRQQRQLDIIGRDCWVHAVEPSIELLSELAE